MNPQTINIFVSKLINYFMTLQYYRNSEIAANSKYNRNETFTGGKTKTHKQQLDFSNVKFNFSAS